MPQSYDIMIRNGWPRGEDTATRDIAVGDGKIVEISAALAGNAETHEGWLEASRYLNMGLLRDHQKEQRRQIAEAA